MRWDRIFNKRYLKSILNVNHLDKNMKRVQRVARKRRIDMIFWLSLGLLSLIMLGIRFSEANTQTNEPTNTPVVTKKNEQKATITASGDMLYHDILFRSAYDGSGYDLDNDYAQIKPILKEADLSLGDFEGTINPDWQLSGYPMFNAPEEVADSIKEAGFDVVDLAHNHILDTGLAGLKSTAATFKKIGIDPIGVETDQADAMVIKEVNGIKIALLAYSYGFNGMEATLTKKQYNQYLRDLDMEKVAADLKEAEKVADITIVMPQSGVEYSLEPTKEQQKNYRKMIDLGADIIFGGHPHVAEPTEIIEKDGERKFIIYSMGNLISDQRFESVGDYWTERGVIMEVEITKNDGGTKLTKVKAHPTWVDKEPIAGRFYQHPEYGTVQAQDYQVFLAENYLPKGKYADTVPEIKRQRIETAYYRMLDLLNIQW